MFKPLRILFALSGMAMLSTLGGCLATVQAEPAYVEVGTIPVNIEIYPHTYYEGRTVYFIDNRWHYRDGPRWAYYREEPPTLYRHRSYVQQAPPAGRRHVVSPRTHRAPAVVAPAARGVPRKHVEGKHQSPRKTKRHER